MQAAELSVQLSELRSAEVFRPSVQEPVPEPVQEQELLQDCCMCLSDVRQELQELQELPVWKTSENILSSAARPA